MATSFRQMRDLLETMDLTCHADEGHEWIYLPYRHWAITVEFAQDGVMFRVPYLARWKQFKKPKQAMRRLMAENSRLKVGHYTVARDGEVQATAFMLVVDREPTADEVGRTLRALCGMAQRFPAVTAGKTPPWTGLERPTSMPPDETPAPPEPPESLRAMFESLADDILDDLLDAAGDEDEPEIDDADDQAA